jgi:glycosyltransferase involved in cell wall biosynthesis
MKRKITFIINNFLIGGTEKLLLDLIRNLDKERFEINIITVLGGGPLENEFKKKGFSVYLAGPKRYPSSILLKALWMIQAPLIILRLSILLKKSKPDVVVTSLYHADVLGILSAWLVGVKERIFIQHDVVRFHIFRKIGKKIFGVGLSTHIIANSRATRDFLISYWNTPEDKITVIHNGIDVHKIEQGIKREYNPEEIILGIVGRLEPIKGHIFLLQALKLLKENHNLSPKTLFVGDGSLRGQLEEFIKENGLNNVQITGTALDIVERLKLIDVLVAPSLSEGFGLVALEGLFSYKIVLASDLPAIREFIIDKKNGLLFKPGDSQQLANTLYQLLSNPVFYQDIKKRTEEWVEEKRDNFDIRNIVLQYEKLF